MTSLLKKGKEGEAKTSEDKNEIQAKTKAHRHTDITRCRMNCEGEQMRRRPMNERA